MKKRLALKLIAACAIATVATAGFAQDVIKISNIVELSGGGATAGTNFKNGVELAVKEINAAGGILGKKIQTITTDTQGLEAGHPSTGNEYVRPSRCCLATPVEPLSPDDASTRPRATTASPSPAASA